MKQSANLLEQESFARTVAHDLYAPLRTMQSFAQVLLQYCADTLGTTEQTYLQRIYETAHRTKHFIRDLLAYSRLDRASLPLQPINLTLIVHQGQAARSTCCIFFNRG